MSRSPMPITLHLPPATESSLTAMAAASGKDLPAFVVEILVAHLALEPLSLRRILGPIHEAIRESGIPGTKLDSLLADVLVAVRNERSGV